jgi:hypothetical protein
MDGGPSRSRPLLKPSESMRGGILATNTRQQPSRACQVSKYYVISIVLVSDEFAEYLIQEPSTLARELNSGV